MTSIDAARQAVETTRAAHEAAQRELVEVLEAHAAQKARQLSITIPAATAAEAVHVEVLAAGQIGQLPTRGEWNVIDAAARGTWRMTVVIWDGNVERVGLAATGCGGDYSGGRIVLCGPRWKMAGVVRSYAMRLGELIAETRRVRGEVLPEETIIVDA